LFDHEVDITDLARRFAYGRDHRKAETDIGNEAAIHHIQVEPFGCTFV